MDTAAKALEAIPHLVAIAEQRGDAITYKQLGEAIGMHHRPLRFVLGHLRDDILIPRGLPLLNCLVVNADTRMPGESWLPAGQQLPESLEDRRAQFEAFRDDVFDYRSWRPLLEELGLDPAPASLEQLKAVAAEAVARSWRGGGGESEYHARLKRHVASNPAVLGLSPTASYIEHVLLSGDRADVAFELDGEWAMAEIKTGALGELVRGVYQSVKYRAVGEAQYGVPVRAYLVAYSMPREVVGLARDLGIVPVVIEESAVLAAAD